MSLSDSKQRQQAINPANSYIVQAPAGSGKTELLIQRYLSLLAVVDAPEHIVAITFTRKAAAEMQDRIINALEQAQQDKVAKSEHEQRTLQLAKKALERDRQKDWNIFLSPSRLRIQTIDALCSSLVRQMPLLATTGSHPDITNEPMRLYEQAAENTLQHVYKDNKWSTAISNILIWLDNDTNRFNRMISEMLAKREQWLPFVTQKHDRATIEHTLQNIIERHLSKLKKLIPIDFQSELSQLIAFAAKNLQEHEVDHPLIKCLGIEGLPGTEYDQLPYWSGIQRLLLTGEGEWRKRINKNDGFPAPSSNKLKGEELKTHKEKMQLLLNNLSSHKELLKAVYDIRMLPSPKYVDQQWSMVENFHQILHLAAAELMLVFQHNNNIDFTEITQSAINSLSDNGVPTDLALYLEYQIQHILVDEFQDISTSQYRLLEGLTAGWSNEENKSLFLVGDPMQSIYRFREAEVGLFIKTWHLKRLAQLSLECLRLDSNFRSMSPIVDWVNEQFTYVLPKQDDISVNAVAFSSSNAVKSADSESYVKTYPILNRNDIFEANKIIELLNNITSKKPDDSIAILVRSRNHLNQLIPLLIKNHIAFHATEIAKLKQLSVVQDLIALTRAYLFLDDRIAWLSVVRAPWCGLKLSSLEKLVNSDNQLLIWDALQSSDIVSSLSKDEQSRLSWLQSAFADAFENKHRTTLRRAVEGLWIRLYGNHLYTENGQTEDAETYFELLNEVEQGSEINSIRELTDKIDHVFTSYGNIKSTNLHVMTIHKAKGLEFDHVILPGLGKRSGRSKNELMMWSMLGELAEQKLVLAPIQATGDANNPIYQYLKEHDRQKQYFEDARLLYVATTRAIKSLHIFGHVLDKRDSANATEEYSVEHQSLFAFLWQRLPEESYKLLEKQTNTERESDVIYINQTIRRRKLDWQPDNPKTHFQQVIDTRIDAENELSIEYDWAGENIKRIGSAIHRFIQSIAEENKNWKQIDFTQQQNNISAYLVQLGINEKLEQATQQVILALTAMQQDGRADWIFDNSHRHIENEFSLSGYIGGNIKRIKIDRTFIDQDNVRWIIDYKSSRHDEDTIDAFLDQEQLRYKPQLETYAELIKQFDAKRDLKEIRLGLYFPMLRGWREWSYS